MRKFYTTFYLEQSSYKKIHTFIDKLIWINETTIIVCLFVFAIVCFVCLWINRCKLLVRRNEMICRPYTIKTNKSYQTKHLQVLQILSYSLSYYIVVYFIFLNIYTQRFLDIYEIWAQLNGFTILWNNIETTVPVK